MRANVVIGDFCRKTFLKRQENFTPSNLHDGQWQEQAEKELLARITSGLSMEKVRPGYRPGVILVGINPEGFKMRHRELVEGDYLFGGYKARVPGETPRKKTQVLHVGEVPPAKYVDAVLYHRDVMIEDGETVPEGVDYEVVALLAKDVEGDEPMDPDTLIANHFGFDGGTSTKMNPEQFEAKLRESVNYWKNRALLY